MYYAPRLAFTQAVTLPTLFGGFPLLRSILLRERITLVHAHQASWPAGHPRPAGRRAHLAFMLTCWERACG